MTIAVYDRPALKAACLALLDEVAIEHPVGHQGKLAARYILRSRGGERIELMFEKGDKSPANIWVERRYAASFVEQGVISREYPAASLFGGSEQKGATFGRHSALKPMRRLANSDLLRFTVQRASELEGLLKHLEHIGA